MPFEKGKSGNKNGRPTGKKNMITEIGFKASDIPVINSFYESVIGSLKGDKYYVYSHEHNGVCFYIGKGKGHRAWDKGNSDRNSLWIDYVSSIGVNYEIKIIAADLSENDAYSIEATLIKSRLPICNIQLLF